MQRSTIKNVKHKLWCYNVLFFFQIISNLVLSLHLTKVIRVVVHTAAVVAEVEAEEDIWVVVDKIWEVV